MTKIQFSDLDWGISPDDVARVWLDRGFTDIRPEDDALVATTVMFGKELTAIARFSETGLDQVTCALETEPTDSATDFARVSMTLSRKYGDADPTDQSTELSWGTAAPIRAGGVLWAMLGDDLDRIFMIYRSPECYAAWQEKIARSMADEDDAAGSLL